jgi:hypothetical protein
LPVRRQGKSKQGEDSLHITHDSLERRTRVFRRFRKREGLFSGTTQNRASTLIFFFFRLGRPRWVEPAGLSQLSGLSGLLPPSPSASPVAHAAPLPDCLCSCSLLLP